LHLNTILTARHQHLIFSANIHLHCSVL
jgi:hypothetical protein